MGGGFFGGVGHTQSQGSVIAFVMLLLWLMYFQEFWRHFVDAINCWYSFSAGCWFSWSCSVRVILSNGLIILLQLLFDSGWWWDKFLWLTRVAIGVYLFIFFLFLYLWWSRMINCNEISMIWQMCCKIPYKPMLSAHTFTTYDVVTAYQCTHQQCACSERQERVHAFPRDVIILTHFFSDGFFQECLFLYNMPLFLFFFFLSFSLGFFL